ncbi:MULTISPECIES: hypothetical protein [unclassified Streptomyces]|uniref:hypothetical protein n=1 Tax=Streptomyces TaxID=1883 RepID=UPI000B8D5E68|nr:MULTISPECIES: hypothetical protein [unclassified Streptomyces]ASQ94461.1 hypothetical protein CGL27_16490 [Streptomyces sp. 11-1-2]RSS49094.1 hypothetical protein EF902_02920 [Streptomyces sp. WAC05858]
MTVLASEPLVEQQANLMRHLAEVLKQYEIGGSFRLMFVPSGLEISDDEVLVQDVNAEERVVEIRPRKLTDLSLGEVLHATQVIDPSDESLIVHAGNSSGWDCKSYTRPNGSTGHLYAT